MTEHPHRPGQTEQPDLPEQMGPPQQSPHGEHDRQPGSGRPGRARLARRAALAAPAVVLLAAAVVLGLQVRADAATQRARTAATQAAEDQAVAVTSVSGADADAGVARVLSAATGNFRTAYEQQAPALRTTLQEQDVRATGTVLDSGVVRAGDRSAVVVVVVEALVANRAQPTPQPRRYRMRLGLEHVGSRWLTSSFEMVL